MKAKTQKVIKKIATIQGDTFLLDGDFLVQVNPWKDHQYRELVYRANKAQVRKALRCRRDTSVNVEVEVMHFLRMARPERTLSYPGGWFTYRTLKHFYIGCKEFAGANLAALKKWVKE